MTAAPAELDAIPLRRVLRPRDAREVAESLAQSRAAGRPLVVRGGGTKLHWGNRSDAAELDCLDLTALDAPLEIAPEEGVVCVGAGVRVAALASAAAQHGKRVRLCAHWAEASVGGTLAADPVTLDLAPDRRARNDVLGLEVALTEGTLARAGGRVVKNVTGFDLVRLYCGAFGTLGVITQATLRLRALPELELCLSREFADRERAIAHARTLESLEPQRLAVLPAGSRWLLLWSFEGAEVDVRARAEVSDGTPLPLDALDVAAAELAAPAPDAPMQARVRLAARPSDTERLCQALEDAGGTSAVRLALPIAGVVLGEAPEAALDALLARAAREQWLAFLEHASRDCKARHDVFGPPPDALALMRALKQRFDPARVLAPGRFVGRI